MKRDTLQDWEFRRDEWDARERRTAATLFTPGPWFDWETLEWLHKPNTLLANHADACLIAIAPEMYECLKGTQAYIETQENETMPDELAALWNRIAAIVGAVEGTRFGEK